MVFIPSLRSGLAVTLFPVPEISPFGRNDRKAGKRELGQLVDNLGFSHPISLRSGLVVTLFPVPEISPFGRNDRRETRAGKQ
jgi:hypothetical protein